MDLRRPLTDSEFIKWVELHCELQGHDISQGRDVMIWSLDKSHKFTAKSLYRFKIDVGIRNKTYKITWKSRVPLKIKVFCGFYTTEKSRHGF